MLTTEAHIQTNDPSRYLVQLCRHAQLAHRIPHRRRSSHDGGDAQPPSKVQHVEWSQTRGTVDFGWAKCTMQATPGTLILRTEAADEDNLRRVQAIVAADIERFGTRDHLTVNWQRPASPATQPSDAG